MVGKNNQRLKNEVQQRQVFALRKLSVGVASVLLGTTCMFINNVHADTVENTSNDNNNNASASANTDASQPYAASESANMQSTAVSTDTNQNTATGQNADQSAATNMAQVVSPAPNTEADSTGDVNQVQAAPATSQKTSSQQPVKVFNAVNTDNTTVNSSASDTTADSPANDYQTFSTDQLNTNETAQPLAALYRTALYAAGGFVPVTPGGGGEQGHQAASWDVQSSYTDARGNVWMFDVNNDPATAKTPNSHGWYYTAALKDVKLSQETLNSKSIVIPGGSYADAATDKYIDAVLDAMSGRYPRDESAGDPFAHPGAISYTIDPELVHRLAQQMETIKFGSLNCSYNGDWTGVFSADSNRYAVGLGEEHPVNTVLKHVDMRVLDMSDVTSFKGLFNKCVNLEDVNFEGNGWKTSKLTNTALMFNGCSALKVLDFRTNQTIQNSSISPNDIFLDTKNVTDMHDMFLNASHLVAIFGLGAFDTSNVSDFHEMFSGCSSLMYSRYDSDALNSYVDLSAWNTSKAENMDWMFRNAGISQLAIHGWHIPAKHAFIFNGMGGYQFIRANNINIQDTASVYDTAYTSQVPFDIPAGKYYLSMPMGTSLGAIVYGMDLKVDGSLTNDDISMNKDTDRGLIFGKVSDLLPDVINHKLSLPPLGFIVSDQNLADRFNRLESRNYALVRTYRGGDYSGDYAGSFFMPIDNAYCVSIADNLLTNTDFSVGGKYNQRLMNGVAKKLDLSKWKVGPSDIKLSLAPQVPNWLTGTGSNIFSSRKYEQMTPEIFVTSSAISQPRTMKVTFVDGSNSVISTQEINGKTNEDTTGTMAFPPGYVLIPNTNMDINGVDNPNLYPTQGNNGGALYYNFHFRDDNTSPTLVVHVQPKVLTIDPSSPVYQNGQTMPDNPSLKFTGISYNDLHKNVTLTATFILPDGQKIYYNYQLGVLRTAYVNEANGEVTYGNWSSAQWDFSNQFNWNIPNSVFSPVHNAIVTSTNGQDAQRTFNVSGQHVTNTINVYDSDDGNKLIKTITVSGISSVDRPIIDIASQLGRSANSFYIDNNNLKTPRLTGGYNDELEIRPNELIAIRPSDSIGQQGLFRIKHLTGTQYQVDLVPNAGPESIYIHHTHENVSRNVQINWSLRYDNVSQTPADKRNEITAQVLGPNDTLEGTPQSIMASPTQSGIAVNHGSHDLFNNTYSWDNNIDFSKTNIKPYKIHCRYGYDVWSSYNTVATVNGQQVGYRLVDDYIPADELMIFDQMGNHLDDYADSLTHNNSTSPVTINFVSHLSYHTYQLRTNVVYRYNGNDLFTDTFVGKLGDQVKIKYSRPRGFIIKAGQNLPNTVDPSKTSQIIVELDQDKDINYRFTDLTDFNNQKMVPTGATNAQGPDWTNISGKENVSQYIPGFDFINGIGTDGMSNYGSYQQYLVQLKSMGYDVANDDTQSFVIDGVMYSPTDAKAMIDKTYDKKFNAAFQKALARWKADRQVIVDETNGYEKQKQEATQHIMSLADQLRTVDPSSQQHADLFKQITNEHNKISLLDNKIDAAWRRLSNIHFETYMNNDMTSLSVIQGFNHMIDAYSSDNKPNADTKLSSGKTINSVAKNSDIYNASSYGDYTSFKLNLNVLRNANGDTWPPEIDHGPVTGFIGPYNTVYTDAHFDDPNYDEIRTGKRDNYQYNLLTGRGYVYSIDDVTGEVTKVLVDGQAMNLPIFYFSQAAGYDLYINGQKVDHGIEHPAISWTQYVNGPHDWTIEYRPLTARVNWKVVDQDGNVLSNGAENVYADSNSSINGRQIADNFISNYNKSFILYGNSNKYAEFISSDIPSGTTVSGQDAADGKTFDYTIRVNVYSRTQVRTSGDTHVRTIYFVNRADPNNSARAITDTVEFDTIKDVFIKDGQEFDIPTQAGGTTIYKAKGSFDDATAKIKAAIGTDNYTVVSGSQYIGAYIPDTPGGDDITIEYN